MRRNAHIIILFQPSILFTDSCTTLKDGRIRGAHYVVPRPLLGRILASFIVGAGGGVVQEPVNIINKYE